MASLVAGDGDAGRVLVWELGMNISEDTRPPIIMEVKNGRISNRIVTFSNIAIFH